MGRTIFRFMMLTALLTLVSATEVSAQTPRRASGVDSLNNGGDLGGNTPPTTLVPVPKDGEPASTEMQCFTLCGRTLTAAPRGQIVILRRRTQGGYLTEKKIMR